MRPCRGTRKHAPGKNLPFQSQLPDGKRRRARPWEICMGRLRRTLLYVVAAVGLVMAAAGAGWAFLQAQHAKDISDPDRARQRGEPIPVRTEPVTQSTVEDVIGATALTDPSEVASIR